jgi:EAL domain-containing protein (putative c-di-GMP-specific phosphodiesterase class I)
LNSLIEYIAIALKDMLKTALLIGVTSSTLELPGLESARKDVIALEEILNHRALGGFDQVKILIDPEVQKMQQEIELFFSDAQPDDLNLLYFSGHGIKDERGHLCFSALNSKTSPKDGKLLKSTVLRSDFIHDAMYHCSAKQQVIILDCCFSGSFDARVAKGAGMAGVMSDLEKYFRADGRVVLTSSDRLEYSYEHPESGLSIYTHHLVHGVRSGHADLDQDGKISIQDLHTYLKKEVSAQEPEMSPKIIVLKDEGYQITLFNAPLEDVIQESWKPEPIYLADKAPDTKNGDSPYTLSFLDNFLSPYEPWIRQFLDGWEIIAAESRLELSYSQAFWCEISRSICQLSNVKGLFIWSEQATGEWQVTLSHGSELEHYDQILRSVWPQTSVQELFSQDSHGTKITGNHETLLLVPLESEVREFLVVFGIPQDGICTGDPFGRILSAIYGLRWQKPQTTEAIEAKIIDALKRDFRFLPHSLYERRFALFQKELQRSIVYFQPIVRLDPPVLSGWEALARDPKTGCAPGSVFAAAELWGTRFTTETDLYFLKVATETYYQQYQSNNNQRFHDMLPLSVNVYPDSLVRRSYREALREILREKKSLREKIILEISEKAALPKPLRWNDAQTTTSEFREILKQYVREGLEVKFAIDDFGVGYASVSRLVGLKLAYVKIDQEVLQYDAEVRARIIAFVRETLVDMGEQPQVVVEGIDAHAPMSLNALIGLGAKAIQGYLIDPALPSIYPEPRLPDAKYKVLEQVLQYR